MAIDMRQAQRGALGSEPGDAARLFEQYSERVLAYCRHVLRAPAEAEDALQTTFLYAHRALQRGVVPEHEYAWLHTIAKNVCRSQLRGISRRRALTGVDLDALPGLDRNDDDRRELVTSLGEALATLPEGQRRALVMREWHGLSSSEIASQLGMTMPATYALLTRARRSLARAISVTTQRPTLSLNFWPLLLKLKGILVGGAAKAATATAVVAGLAVGGVAVERAVVDDGPPAPALEGSADRATGTSGAAGRKGAQSAAVDASWRSVRGGASSSRAGRFSELATDGTAVRPQVPGGDTTAISVPAEVARPTPTPPSERVNELTETLPVPDPVGEVIDDLTDPLPIPDVDLPPPPLDLPVDENDPLGEAVPDPLADPPAAPPLPPLPPTGPLSLP